MWFWSIAIIESDLAVAKEEMRSVDEHYGHSRKSHDVKIKSNQQK